MFEKSVDTQTWRPKSQVLHPSLGTGCGSITWQAGSAVTNLGDVVGHCGVRTLTSSHWFTGVPVDARKWHKMDAAQVFSQQQLLQHFHLCDEDCC